MLICLLIVFFLISTHPNRGLAQSDEITFVRRPKFLIYPTRLKLFLSFEWELDELYRKLFVYLSRVNEQFSLHLIQTDKKNNVHIVLEYHVASFKTVSIRSLSSHWQRYFFVFNTSTI